MTKKICNACLIPPVAPGGLGKEGGGKGRRGRGGEGAGCEEDFNVEDGSTFDYYFSGWKRGLTDVQLLYAVP